ELLDHILEVEDRRVVRAPLLVELAAAENLARELLRQLVDQLLRPRYVLALRVVHDQRLAMVDRRPRVLLVELDLRRELLVGLADLESRITRPSTRRVVRGQTHELARRSDVLLPIEVRLGKPESRF